MTETTYSTIGMNTTSKGKAAALVVFKLRKMGVPAQEVTDNPYFDVVAFPFGQTIRIKLRPTESNDKRGVMRFRLTTGVYGEEKRPYNLTDADLVAFVALHLEAVTFLACIDLTEIINITKSRFEKDVILGDSFALECQKVWNATGLFDPPKKQRKKRIIPDPKTPVW